MIPTHSKKETVRPADLAQQPTTERAPEASSINLQEARFSQSISSVKLAEWAPPTVERALRATNWLSWQISTAEVTKTTGMLALTTVTSSYFFQQVSSPLSTWAVLFATCISGMVARARINVGRNHVPYASVPREENPLHDRMSETVRDLCKFGNVPEPQVSIARMDPTTLALTRQRPMVCALNRYNGPALICIPENIEEKLSEEQLKSVLAHELAHTTHQLFKVQDLNNVILAASMPVTMASSYFWMAEILQTSIPTLPLLFTSAGSLLLTTIGAKLVLDTVGFLSSFTCRKDEMRTDIEAALIYPESAYSLVPAIQLLKDPSLRERAEPARSNYFAKHPTSATRAQSFVDLFGPRP